MLYFKNLVKDFETYAHNNSGTAAKQGYESANMAADIGNKLRKYSKRLQLQQQRRKNWQPTSAKKQR